MFFLALQSRGVRNVKPLLSGMSNPFFGQDRQPKQACAVHHIIRQAPADAGGRIRDRGSFKP